MTAEIDPRSADAALARVLGAPKADGLHHVTTIAGDPNRAHAFYAGALGLRLVKRTVNFDDPSAYHFYFGDRAGAPGSILTLFSGADAPAGRVGLGQAVATQFAAPEGAIDGWARRFDGLGAPMLAREEVFGEERLVARDPDGAIITVTATSDAAAGPGWDAAGISDEMAIRGLRGVTLALDDAAPTRRVLTDVLGYAELGEEPAPGGRLIRLRAGSADARGAVVDLHEAGALPEGAEGRGVVHHVAFAARDAAHQLEIREAAMRAGLSPTPPIDRDYFVAIYFRTPGGVLFEVATAGPGFAVDEPEDRLGATLQLPKPLRARRAELEQALAPLDF